MLHVKLVMESLFDLVSSNTHRWNQTFTTVQTSKVLPCLRLRATSDYYGKSVPVASRVGGCLRKLLHTCSTLLVQLLRAGNAAHLFANDK